MKSFTFANPCFIRSALLLILIGGTNATGYAWARCSTWTWSTWISTNISFELHRRTAGTQKITRLEKLTFTMLEEHLKAWRSVCQNHTRVLPWERRTNQMSNMFKNFLKRCGITKGSLYALRHSFASHLAMADVNLAKIDKLMEHSDIRTAQIYSHLQPFRLKEAVFRLTPIA
ncbi:MAG: Tyrosine recombinase XerD [Elusimicrobia bacterium]|nr:Tyrosine recombinase XerD [Elusimicrobiota bacterium]